MIIEDASGLASQKARVDRNNRLWVNALTQSSELIHAIAGYSYVAGTSAIALTATGTHGLCIFRNQLREYDMVITRAVFAVGTLTGAPAVNADIVAQIAADPSGGTVESAGGSWSGTTGSITNRRIGDDDLTLTNEFDGSVATANNQTLAAAITEVGARTIPGIGVWEIDGPWILPRSHALGAQIVFPAGVTAGGVRVQFYLYLNRVMEDTLKNP